MYNIKIENCNNIKDGNVKVEEGKLNIKYGINGTGKTTIAKAIEYSLDGEKLTSLQTYYSDNPAKITITPSIQKIMVFNEDFVNQIVFVQDEVIEKSFEVFLKTSNYDQKKEALDNHLEKLHELFSVNPEIIALRQELADISQRFKRTNTGKLSNTDLIILDDPISSFDSNKKYAILHRMFKKFGKKDVSLEGKTVLLLTHDFEPITDFIVVGKLDADKAQASFIWNKDGIVSECEIDPDKDVCLILRECEKIANDDTVNIVSRIAFLRKLCELNGKIKEWGYAYEILSCLVHTKEIKRKVANGVYVDMPEREKEEGLKKIKEFIPSFDYDDLRKVLYTVSGLKNLYDIEDNAYFKIQIFREMCEIESQKIKLSTFDEGWYKYIDETYHIENDYLHYLDITKFNIVPNYILKKVDELMNSL